MVLVLIQLIYLFLFLVLLLRKLNRISIDVVPYSEEAIHEFLRNKINAP